MSFAYRAFFLGFGLFFSLAVGAATTTADADLERLLAAVGGREAWAAAVNTRNDSQQNRVADPVEVRAVIHIDFVQPRVRIETTGPDLHLIRAIDGDTHWRKTREGAIEPLPEQTLADDRRWYAAHVYRTLHRLAKRDPALSVRHGQDGRLEVVENGARLAWFKLDARGEPYAFGAHDNDAGTLSGPWIHRVQGIRHPAWVSSPDGTWRAMLKDLQVNVSLPDTLFARPKDTAASSAP
jgi:hypothetical protein